MQRRPNVPTLVQDRPYPRFIDAGHETRRRSLERLFQNEECTGPAASIPHLRTKVGEADAIRTGVDQVGQRRGGGGQDGRIVFRGSSRSVGASIRWHRRGQRPGWFPAVLL